MKIKKINLKAVVITIVIIGFIGTVFLINYLKAVNNYREDINSITISRIDLNSIENGTYVGEYDVNFIYAKVEVTIQDGKIANINLLEHKNDRGQLAEQIIDKIIAEQSLDVDVISSATNSSKVIKKAIENAILSIE